MLTDFLRLRDFGCVCGVDDDDTRTNDVAYFAMVIIQLVLFLFRFTPESIRWYITHDKIDKAEKELRDIARINKKEYPEEVIKVPVTSTKSLSCLALFSSWSLAFSVVIQAVGW